MDPALVFAFMSCLLCKGFLVSLFIPGSVSFSVDFSQKYVQVLTPCRRSRSRRRRRRSRAEVGNGKPSSARTTCYPSPLFQSTSFTSDTRTTCFPSRPPLSQLIFQRQLVTHFTFSHLSLVTSFHPSPLFPSTSFTSDTSESFPPTCYFGLLPILTLDVLAEC